MNNTTPNVRQALLIAIAAVTIAIAFSQPASADRRIFPFSYPYMTLPKGGMELEHYLTANVIEADDPSTLIVEDGVEPDWTHEFELEYAITDHWDVGVYQVFHQSPFDSLEYLGPKLRTRYRFGEQGDLPVDPALYIEVAYFNEEIEIEDMLILSKVVGQMEGTFNLKFEQEFEDENGEWETAYKFNPSLGVGYHFTERFALGIEYVGVTENEHGDWSGYAQFLGPFASVSTNRFWWTLGVEPQITDFEEFAELQARSIIGLRL